MRKNINNKVSCFINFLFIILRQHYEMKTLLLKKFPDELRTKEHKDLGKYFFLV